MTAELTLSISGRARKESTPPREAANVGGGGRGRGGRRLDDKLEDSFEDEEKIPEGSESEDLKGNRRSMNEARAVRLALRGQRCELVSSALCS